MPSTPAQLAKIIRSFKGRTIGVLGDFMLDELLRGEATRISPEAPVPIVLMDERSSELKFLGGAGNVAANVAVLGGRPIPFGAIGRDISGESLRELLEGRGIRSNTLVAEQGRVTPRKVRVVAHQHQLLRLDFERPQRISTRAADLLSRSLARWVGRMNALIISDYRKGNVTMELSSRAKSLARQRRIPVCGSQAGEP
jgi:rfaE bifunctional protein kinase chain/domain